MPAWYTRFTSQLVNVTVPAVEVSNTMQIVRSLVPTVITHTQTIRSFGSWLQRELTKRQKRVKIHIEMSCIDRLCETSGKQALVNKAQHNVHCPRARTLSPPGKFVSLCAYIVNRDAIAALNINPCFIIAPFVQ